ncbi:competence protein CoiA [Facklamia sp. 7083-14-GEN3]|uniref:competence protein CoiA n=1 Tax=Facklamia sp. 7083-14-GEN3 TaxID=2973478 RepID=UPI00215BB9BB|nr:competence protein CoiA family protein [Facklamia sp. 7083-14-GEN3]MCR8969468.1 competence protein CoiA family protein [Facklamia sp. 7083-14-GEN3]
MYAARNQEGELIYAREARKDQAYVCPHCLNKVVLIRKERGRSYFRHIKSCSKDIKDEENHLILCLQKHNRGESKEHKQAKALLLENFQRFGYQCKQEAVFGKINQIVDVMIKDSSGIRIVEYQKSVISAIELYKRQKNYKSLGFRVQWLIDDHYFNQKVIRQWARRCLVYSNKLDYHVWTLNLKHQKLKCYHHIPLVYCLDSLDFQVTNFSFKDNWISAFNESLKSKTDSKNLYRENTKSRKIALKDHSFIIRSIKSNPSYQFFLSQLYNYQINLEEIPRWVFNNNWNMLAFKEPGWLIWIWAIESMFWITNNTNLSFVGDGLNFSTFSLRMNEHLKKKHFNMLSFPLLVNPKILSEETFYSLYNVLRIIKK